MEITRDLLKKRAEHNDCDLSTLEEITLHQYDIEQINSTLQNSCKRLKILYLQSNQISKIENLNKLKELEYLNLALNNIQRIENLSECESLTKLDLTINFIQDISCLNELKQNERLEDLYLTGNPCTQLEGYRYFVISTLPQLKRLDGQEILKSERLLASQVYPSLLEKYSQSNESNVHITETVENNTIENDSHNVDNTIDHNVEEIEPIEPIDTTNVNEQSNSFKDEITYHTPESRIKTARELAERRKKEEPFAHLKPKPAPEAAQPKFDSNGKVLQKNEGKFQFCFQETDTELHLTIELSKFLDSSLIKVDSHDDWIHVTVKNKSLILLLPVPVMSNEGEALRSQCSGDLLIKLPLKNPKKKLITKQQVMQEVIDLTRNKKEIQQVPKVVKCIPKKDEEFIDDPSVPPLC